MALSPCPWLREVPNCGGKLSNRRSCSITACLSKCRPTTTPAHPPKTKPFICGSYFETFPDSNSKSETTSWWQLTAADTQKWSQNFHQTSGRFPSQKCFCLEPTGPVGPLCRALATIGARCRKLSSRSFLKTGCTGRT